MLHSRYSMCGSFLKVSLRCEQIVGVIENPAGIFIGLEWDHKNLIFAPILEKSCETGNLVVILQGI